MATKLGHCILDSMSSPNLGQHHEKSSNFRRHDRKASSRVRPDRRDRTTLHRRRRRRRSPERRLLSALELPPQARHAAAAAARSSLGRAVRRVPLGAPPQPRRPTAAEAAPQPLEARAGRLWRWMVRHVDERAMESQKGSFRDNLLILSYLMAVLENH